jgi:hypothetical protein
MPLPTNPVPATTSESGVAWASVQEWPLSGSL